MQAPYSKSSGASSPRLEQGCPPALPDPVCIQDRLAPEPSDSAPQQQQKKSHFTWSNIRLSFAASGPVFSAPWGSRHPPLIPTASMCLVAGGPLSVSSIQHGPWTLFPSPESKSIILHVEITLRSGCSFRQYPPSTLRSQFIAKGFTVELQFEQENRGCLWIHLG